MKKLNSRWPLALLMTFALASCNYNSDNKKEESDFSKTTKAGITKADWGELMEKKCISLH